MQNENQFLKTEKVGKLLRMFSIPCVLSLVIQALYNLVDQIFIGHEVNLGADGNAATGIVYGLTVIALGLGLWIGDGSAACMSINQGRKDVKGTAKIVGQAITYGCIVSILLTILCFIFKDAFLSGLGGFGKILEFAKTYSTFIFFGFIFFILACVINPIIRADGSPKYAMLAMAIGAIINIILDPILLYVFHMGMNGAAVATFIGQLITFILHIGYLFKSKTFKLTVYDFIPRKDIISIIKFGISSFLTQFSIFLITLVTNKVLLEISVRSGYETSITQGAITLAFKVFGIVVSIGIGIASGGQPIIGYNYGAGRIDRVKQTLKIILISTVIVGLVATLLFEICPQIFLYIFGDGGGTDKNYKETYAVFVNKVFRIYLSCILATCLIKVLSIFFQSIGSSIKATITSMVRDIILLIPLTLILGLCGNINLFLWSSPIADIGGCILAFLLLLATLSSLKNKEIEEEPFESPIIMPSIEGPIITIAREHGASGREIGKLLAEKLEIPYYDKDLVLLTAEKTGLSQSYILRLEKESLYQVSDLYLGLNPTILARNAQEEVLNKIASSGSCVIVGRCADFVLKEYHPIRIFIHASDEYRVKKIMEKYNDSYEEAKKNILKSDKRRENYYNQITGNKWKDFKNYDLVIDSTIGVEQTVDFILQYLNPSKQRV